MKYIEIGKKLTEVSQLALGCMRMRRYSLEEVTRVLSSAQDIGINFFDHADVYGHGESEVRFAQGIRAANISRDKIFIQSKCGIQRENGDYYFDFSKEHILQAVEGSLKRLETDYLDVLLLHRPDALVEPEEVAEAFEQLYREGKVLNFGVSNHNTNQIELLQKFCQQPLVINQLEFGPAHTPMLDAGLNVNAQNERGIVRDGGILDYCRLHEITVQPWSPFQVDLVEGLFMNHPKYQELTATITRLAEEYHVPFEALVIAWIIRHPANMQPIIGSMNPKRIEAMAAAFDIELSRQEWYQVYKSAGNPLP